jgi:hypothetical protein
MHAVVKAWGLGGALDYARMTFLFHGGVLSQSSGHADGKLIEEWRQACPIGGILGGALPYTSFPGSLRCGLGLLACREMWPSVSGMWPTRWLEDIPPLVPAEALVSAYQHTRGAGQDKHALLSSSPAGDGEEEDEKSSQMIMGGQCVIPGAVFLQRVTLSHAPQLELGALLYSLAAWQLGGGTVGGSAARGYGVLSSRWRVTDAATGGDVATDGLIDRFLTHLESQKDAGRAWLDKAFRSKEDRPGKRGKKPAKESAA